MKLGGEYRLKYITRNNWEKLGREVRLAPEAVIGRVLSLAAKMEDATMEVSERVRKEGLRHKIVGRLTEVIVRRAENCARLLAA